MTEQLPDAERAVRAFYVIRFVESLNFVLPVWVIFGHDYLGVSYLTTVLLLNLPKTFFAACLQIPCGAWADRHGRKKAYVFGTLCVAIASVPFVLTQQFWVLLATVPFLALGTALCEGSLESIVSVVAGASSKERYADISANGVSVFYVARVVASAGGGALYFVDPRLPFAAIAISALIALIVVTRLPSVADSDTRLTGSVRTIVSEATRAIHADGTIWWALALLLLIIVAAELAWLGYQPTFRDHGLNAAVVGIAFAVFSLISAIGSQVVKRAMRTRTVAAIARWQLGLFMATAVGLSVVPGAWVLLTTVPLQLAIGTRGPVLRSYIASRTAPELRATSLSFVDLIEGVSTAAAAIAAGLILDGAGPNWLFAGAVMVGLAGLAVAQRSRLRQTA